jgi:hypothetical protein
LDFFIPLGKQSLVRDDDDRRLGELREGLANSVEGGESLAGAGRERENPPPAVGAPCCKPGGLMGL